MDQHRAGRLPRSEKLCHIAPDARIECLPVALAVGAEVVVKTKEADRRETVSEPLQHVGRIVKENNPGRWEEPLNLLFHGFRPTLIVFEYSNYIQQ